MAIEAVGGEVVAFDADAVTPEAGEGAAAEIYHTHRGLDAATSCNDYVATGLLMQARALRIRVPKDICIAGFDNIDSARFVSLTTIDMGSEHNGLRRRANYWIFRAMPFLNTRAQAVSRAKAYYDEARFALEF